MILDSSVAIAAERRGDTVASMLRLIVTTTGDQRAVLSSVGVTELVHGIYRAPSAEARNRREDFLRELLDDVEVYPYTKETALLAGRIDGEQQRLLHLRRRRLTSSSKNCLRKRKGRSVIGRVRKRADREAREINRENGEGPGGTVHNPYHDIMQLGKRHYKGYVTSVPLNSPPKSKDRCKPAVNVVNCQPQGLRKRRSHPHCPFGALSASCWCSRATKVSKAGSPCKDFSKGSVPIA